MQPISAARVPALDALRGVAILMIILVHWVVNSVPHGVWTPPAITYIRHVLMLSWSGVDLFFVLSGFLIGGILLDQRGAENLFSVFYTRRVCRILPLYVLTLATYWAVMHLLPRETPDGLSTVLATPFPKWVYFTLTQNYYPGHPAEGAGNYWLGVTWSLAVEEQFYIVLPLLIVFLPARWVPRALLVGVVSAPIIRTLLVLFTDRSFATHAAYGWSICRMDSLLLGALGAWAIRREGFREALRRRPIPVAAAASMLLAGMVVATAFRWNTDSVPMMTVGYTWLALFYLCVLLAVYLWPPPTRLILPLTWMGIGAYAIYLFHRPIGVITHAVLLGRSQSIADYKGVAATAVAGVVTVLVAIASWFLIEKPLIALGRRQKYAGGKALRRELTQIDTAAGRNP